jgi:hypothetical protein
MQINPETLSSLATDYAKGMTSIRGRRVQRLLRREFAGAEYVLVLEGGSGVPGVVGLSTTGAAFCATAGKGRHASVFSWLHGSKEALETRFDLLKDSLPVLSSSSVPLAGLRRQAHLHISAGSAPPEAGTLVAMAAQVLASPPLS